MKKDEPYEPRDLVADLLTALREHAGLNAILVDRVTQQMHDVADALREIATAIREKRK